MSGEKVPSTASSKGAVPEEKVPSYTDPSFHRGSSEFTYPNGDKYVGEFCAHNSGLVWKEGQGTYYTNDGQSYCGNWYDDKLIEGSVVEITFKDGTVYEGQLEHYKYNGASCFTLPGNLKLVLEFVDNKPVGEVILLDNSGRPWCGVTEEDHAVLYQENIYYENIPENRGKGTLRTKKQVKHELSSEQIDKEQPDMAELEKLIFRKNDKLPEDYEFENSEWYKNYLNFKKKQNAIMYKVKKGLKHSMTEEEFQWYMKYEDFKKRYQKIMAKRKIKPSDPIDFSMFHSFCNEQYMNSKPEFVMYPTKKIEASQTSELK